MVSPNSALLSPRGRVLENGMPRFFRRLAESVFDEGDVRRRAFELADFVEDRGADTASIVQSRLAIPTAQVLRQP
jgi:predicted esterase